MANDSLDILIRVQSDVTGARQANDAIAETQRVVKQSGEATQEAGEKTEQFNGHSREMHKVMKLIAHEAGPLGHMLHFLFNPAALGVSAGIFAVEHFRQELEKVKKAAEESAEAAEAALARFAELNRKVAEEAGLSWDEFARKMKEAGEAPDKVATKFEGLTKQIDAATEAEKKLLEAQKAFELVKVDGSDQTPEQKEKAKAAIEARYSAATQALDERKAEDILANKKAELAVREGKDTILTPTAAGAEKQKHDVDARLESLTKSLGDFEKVHSALQKAADDSRNAYLKITMNGPEKETALRKAGRDVNELLKFEQEHNRDTREHEELTRRKAELDANATKATKAAAENRQRIQQLETEIGQLENIAAVTRPFVEKTKTVNAMRTPEGLAAEGERAAARSIPGVNGQADIAAHNTLTAAAQVEQHVRDHVGDPKGNNAQLHGILNRVIGLLENKNVSPANQTALREFEQRLMKLEHQMQSAHSGM